eukprot:jgi/Psemu1/28636/gm1.28636_g
MVRSIPNPNNTVAPAPRTRSSSAAPPQDLRKKKPPSLPSGSPTPTAGKRKKCARQTLPLSAPEVAAPPPTVNPAAAALLSLASASTPTIPAAPVNKMVVPPPAPPGAAPPTILDPVPLLTAPVAPSVMPVPAAIPIPPADLLPTVSYDEEEEEEESDGEVDTGLAAAAAGVTVTEFNLPSVTDPTIPTLSFAFFKSLAAHPEAAPLVDFIPDPEALMMKIRRFYVLTRTPIAPKKRALVNWCMLIHSLDFYKLFVQAQYQLGVVSMKFRCLFATFRKNGITYSQTQDFNKAGGFQAYWKNIFKIAKTYKVDYGTCPNKARFDKDWYNKRNKAINNPSNPLDPFNNLEHFVWCAMENIMTEWATHGCTEPSSIVKEDFKTGVFTEGEFVGIEYIRLKPNYNGQKKRSLSLKNPVLDDRNTKKTTLPCPYNGDPMSTYQTTIKLLSLVPDNCEGNRINEVLVLIATSSGYENPERCAAHSKRHESISKVANAGVSASLHGYPSKIRVPVPAPAQALAPAQAIAPARAPAPALSPAQPSPASSAEESQAPALFVDDSLSVSVQHSFGDHSNDSVPSDCAAENLGLMTQNFVPNESPPPMPSNISFTTGEDPPPMLCHSLINVVLATNTTTAVVCLLKIDCNTRRIITIASRATIVLAKHDTVILENCDTRIAPSVDTRITVVVTRIMTVDTSHHDPRILKPRHLSFGETPPYKPHYNECKPPPRYEERKPPPPRYKERKSPPPRCMYKSEYTSYEPRYEERKPPPQGLKNVVRTLQNSAMSLLVTITITEWRRMARGDLLQWKCFHITPVALTAGIFVNPMTQKFKLLRFSARVLGEMLKCLNGEHKFVDMVIRTNFKAGVAEAGAGGTQIEMKFWPQLVDPVNGNDFIYPSFDPNVHYLSMVASVIKWIVKEKSVYNVSTGRVEKLRFLCMNFIDMYNNEMGGVDIADQLRESYQVQTWLCNRKWWWALMFWGLGVCLTNVHELGEKYQGGLVFESTSQCQWGKARVAIVLIDPTEFLPAESTIEPSQEHDRAINVPRPVAHYAFAPITTKIDAYNSGES